MFFVWDAPLVYAEAAFFVGGALRLRAVTAGRQAGSVAESKLFADLVACRWICSNYEERGCMLAPTVVWSEAARASMRRSNESWLTVGACT